MKNQNRKLMTDQREIEAEWRTFTEELFTEKQKRTLSSEIQRTEEL